MGSPTPPGSSDEDEVEVDTFFKPGAINNESQLADQMHAMFTWEGALQYPNPVGDAIHRKEHKFVESETVLVVLEPKIGASLATYKKYLLAFGKNIDRQGGKINDTSVCGLL